MTQGSGDLVLVVVMGGENNISAECVLFYGDDGESDVYANSLGGIFAKSDGL